MASTVPTPSPVQREPLCLLQPALIVRDPAWPAGPRCQWPVWPGRTGQPWKKNSLQRVCRPHLLDTVASASHAWTPMSLYTIKNHRCTFSTHAAPSPHCAHHLSLSSWPKIFDSIVDIDKAKTKHVHSKYHSLNLMAIMN